jgi:hypothetical protein
MTKALVATVKQLAVCMACVTNTISACLKTHLQNNFTTITQNKTNENWLVHNIHTAQQLNVLPLQNLRCRQNKDIKKQICLFNHVHH